VTIHQLLEELRQGTARISELVRAVKLHAKPDTGTLRTADIHEGLESSLTILGYKLKQAKAVVTRDYDRTLPPLESYGAELSQVWTNLIDNAADAVSPNGGAIRVRTVRGGAGVGVEIADNGPGIPADALDRIFEPFFTTKGASGGTGLGLEIAKRIVTRHGGTIAVTSKPADTRFTVWLPVTQTGRS
jgi:signal transduction histidine kinase